MREPARATLRFRKQPSVVRYRLRACQGAFVVGVLLGTATPVWAFDDASKSAALQHYQTAKRYYEQRQYLEAAKRFEAAFQELPLPVTALWAARAYDLAGDLASSQALYLAATRLAPNELWLGDKQQRAQGDANRELELLTKRAALGAQTVAIKRENSSAKPREAVLSSDLALAPPQSDQAPIERSPWRTVGWVSLSAGGAALAVGSVTGLMLGSRHGSMQSDCPQSTCDPRLITRDQVDEHNHLRVASSVAFVMGGLLGAAGLTLILATPTRELSPELALRITPNGPLLQGSF